MLGAGPSGIAVALALHLAGLNVCLIGRAAGTGPKIGEFLPASLRRMLRALELPEPEALVGRDNLLHCKAKASAWGTDDWTYQDSLRDPEGGGWHILRDRFEHALLRHAEARGIRFHDAKLEELSDNGTVFRVQARGTEGVTVESPRLVDATGRAAWLVRRLARAPRRHNTQMAVAGWYTDPRPEREHVTTVKSVRHGWWYTAPLPGGLRVLAFHGLPDQVSDHFHAPGQFLAEARSDGLSDVLEHSMTKLGPLQSCEAGTGLSPAIAGKRWVAVGDAALCLDPLSSQGLQFAFYSAIKARDALYAGVKNASTQDALDAAQRYCRQVSDVYRANQRARFLFYAQEQRYRGARYWKAQQENFAMA